MSIKTEKNDNITVAMEKKPRCNVELNIQISPLATKAARQRAIKNINKEISIPGFRKGRAPESYILDNYESHVKKEWEEVLINTSFKEALSLLNVYPLNNKVIGKPDIKSVDLEKGSEFAIGFETAPVIPSIDTEKLTIDPVEQEEVTEKQVEETIENVRLHHAEWNVIEDRAVEEGDYLNLDIKNLDKDEIITEGNRFHCTKQGMGTWMRKLLIGKKTGETVEGVSEKETEESVDFIPTKLQITINLIEAPSLPELDEEFFKKVGVTSLDELKKKVREQLEGHAFDNKKAKLQQALESQLADTHSCEIPQSIFESEKAQRVAEFKRVENPTDEAVEEFEKNIEPHIQKALTIYFLIQKAAEEHAIKVSNEEIQQEMMQLMFSGQLGQEQMQNMEAIQSSIYLKLQRKKVDEFLLDKIGLI